MKRFLLAAALAASAAAPAAAQPLTVEAIAKESIERVEIAKMAALYCHGASYIDDVGDQMMLEALEALGEETAKSLDDAQVAQQSMAAFTSSAFFCAKARKMVDDLGEDEMPLHFDKHAAGPAVQTPAEQAEYQRILNSLSRDWRGFKDACIRDNNPSACRNSEDIEAVLKREGCELAAGGWNCDKPD